MRESITNKYVRRVKTIENHGAVILQKAREDFWLRSALQSASQIDDAAVITAIFDLFEDADPTRHKEYLLWIALQYVKGYIRSAEDIPARIKPALRTYHKLKQSSLHINRDITRLNACQLEALIAQHGTNDWFNPNERGNSKEVFRDNDVRVIVPLDHMAAYYYGRGTRWCTSSADSESIFEAYNDEGPLHILLPQSPERIDEKYQLHFPQGQFMDEDDRPVSLAWLAKQRFKDLCAFFKIHKPRIGDYIAFASDAVLERLIKQTANFVLTNIVSEPSAFQRKASEVLKISAQHCRTFVTESTDCYIHDPHIRDFERVIADMVMIEFSGQDQGLSAWIKNNIYFNYDVEIRRWSACLLRSATWRA